MGGKKTKHRQLWIKSHEPNWNTSPYAIPSGSTSVFLYTSTPFHLHFGWWMDLQVHSECKICENTAKNTHTNKLNLDLHGTNMPLMISADVEIQKLFIQKISACFHTVTANTHPVTPLKPQDVPRQILPNGILRIISVFRQAGYKT